MNRRHFLRNAAVSMGAFAFSGLVLPGRQQAQAASITISLTASTGNRLMPDGTTLPIWQFNSLTPGPGNLAAGIVGNPNDTIVMVLRNNLDRAINLTIPGLLENTVACQPGAQKSYSVTLPATGSFLITDRLNGELGQAMGLAAPLVIQNPLNSFGNGQVLDAEYTLFLQDFDSNLNSAISSGLSFDMANYEPNYYSINGLAYPQTIEDSSTYIQATLNQNIGLRFINAGLIAYPMHFHGYHVKVVNRNRVAEQFVIEKDTVPVMPDECVDVVLPITQTGTYPLHSHYLPAVTVNGIYANAGNTALGEPAMGGGLLLINAV